MTPPASRTAPRTPPVNVWAHALAVTVKTRAKDASGCSNGLLILAPPTKRLQKNAGNRARTQTAPRGSIVARPGGRQRGGQARRPYSTACSRENREGLAE